MTRSAWPDAKKRIDSGEKFSVDEVNDFYRRIVNEIEAILGTDASISIEVAADADTMAPAIVEQAHMMMSWASHPHIKIPITHEGLKAGEELVREGVHLNYTLNFSEQQAAAVHAASRGSADGQVYISPFRGRLDDSGANGAAVIDAIQDLYSAVDSPVHVLVASVRDYDTFLYALAREIDIITVPFRILEQWAAADCEVPATMNPPVYGADVPQFVAADIDGNASWETFDLSHPKTDEGLAKFAADWEQLVDVN